MAGKVTAREVRPGDVEFLAANLRAADHAEVIASHGEDVLGALFEAVNGSTHVFAAERDGRLIALWGFAPVNFTAGIGCPWALGTDEMFRIGRSMTRLARASLAIVYPLYPTLRNHVDARNTRSVAWLRMLGFVIGEPVPYGVAGLPFHPFELT